MAADVACRGRDRGGRVVEEEEGGGAEGQAGSKEAGGRQLALRPTAGEGEACASAEVVMFMRVADGWSSGGTAMDTHRRVMVVRVGVTIWKFGFKSSCCLVALAWVVVVLGGAAAAAAGQAGWPSVEARQ